MTNEADSRIAVVTDSCADFTHEFAASYGIEVVPLTLHIDGESMPDRTLSMEEFFRRMNEASALPTTSQPSVGAFVETYRRVLEHAEEIVSVHISSQLSGTFSSAEQAAAEFPGRVHVLDTLNLSWGQGFQVIEVAKAAAEGLGVKDIIDRFERARDRVQLLVGVDSLEQLVRSGRVSRVAGALGGMLGVKVLITPDASGKIVVARPVRGAKPALEYGMKWVEERMQGARSGAFAIMHALSPENAEWLERAVRERFNVSELHMVETGIVIATHTGTGWGIAFLPED